MKDLHAVFHPDHFYHVFNRANGEENLFVSNDNYNYFLLKYKFYILPIADLYAYCLMPNHFHFIVKIKTEVVLEQRISNHLLKVKHNKFLQGFETFSGQEKQNSISQYISKQWSHLFNSYTQAFNKLNNRKGSLFMKNFKRIDIKNEAYLKKLIHYTHYNPVEASLVSKPENWRYSSYQSFIAQKPTQLMRKAVIELFEDVDNFSHCHQNPPNLTGLDKFF